MLDAVEAAANRQQAAEAALRAHEQNPQHWAEQLALLAPIAHNLDAHRRATEVVGQLEAQAHGELRHTRRSPIRPWHGLRAQARREPDGGWRGSLWVPTRAGDLVFRAEVPAHIVRAICTGETIDVGHGPGCRISGSVIDGFYSIGALGTPTPVRQGAKAKTYPAGYGAAEWTGPSTWEDEEEEDVDPMQEAEEMAGLDIGFLWFVPLIAAGIGAAASIATSAIAAGSRGGGGEQRAQEQRGDRPTGSGPATMVTLQPGSYAGFQGAIPTGAAMTGAPAAQPIVVPASGGPPQLGAGEDEEEDWVEGWSVGAGGGGGGGAAGGGGGGGGAAWGAIERGIESLGRTISSATGSGGGGGRQTHEPRRRRRRPRRTAPRTPAPATAPAPAPRPRTGRQRALDAARGGQLDANQLRQLVAQLGAGSLLADAGDSLGPMSPALSHLLRGALRSVDAQAASMLGDPDAIAAVRMARQRTEGRVQAALRIADALLELTAPR